MSLLVGRFKKTITYGSFLRRFIGYSQRIRNYADEVTIDIEDEYKLFLLDEGPGTAVKLNKSEAILLYTQMQTIRRLEASANALYKEKIIRGFCHLYSGQEAIAVGIKAAMRPQDNCITAYRCHGWSYLMGITISAILAELTGRQSGCQRGKGGSMHMYAPQYFGGNGIVGAQVPLGSGVALACKYREKECVCITCYGDGAANQGQVFEAYNMACLWKLPIVYVCENNRYGMGTKSNRAACDTNFYKRGNYLPGIWVNGMHVLTVRNAAEFAIKYALQNGPIILEMDTYRYHGHSMSDPGTSYRSREEVQDVRKQRDPILHFRQLCIGENLITEEELNKLDKKIKSEIDKKAETAKADKEIELKELSADVYAANVQKYIRGVNGKHLKHFNTQSQGKKGEDPEKADDSTKAKGKGGQRKTDKQLQKEKDHKTDSAKVIEKKAKTDTKAEGEGDDKKSDIHKRKKEKYHKSDSSKVKEIDQQMKTESQAEEEGDEKKSDNHSKKEKDENTNSKPDT